MRGICWDDVGSPTYTPHTVILYYKGVSEEYEGFALFSEMPKNVPEYLWGQFLFVPLPPNENSNVMEQRFNTGETKEELKQKYNPEGSNLRRAQLRLMDMLIYLQEAAQKAGVSIRLDGGNILGAVRHGGFIPWDDDIDVVIDRKDYKRFCQYLLEHPHPQYVLQTHETNRDYFIPWGQLTDLQSEYTCPYAPDSREGKAWRRQKLHGLHIDIFPYEGDKIPCLHALSIKLSTTVCFDIAVRWPSFAHVLFCLLRDGVYPVFRLMGKVFGHRNLYMHSYGSWFRCQFPKDVLLPHKPIAFEGHEFEGPADKDRFCCILYKDYMNLPPADKRAVHGNEIIFSD